MEKQLTNEEKEHIRRLRALKNPDGSHVHTLDALGERFKVSHQRISAICTPDPQRERNRRHLAKPKTKRYQRRYQKSYIKRYMRHYRHHMQAGIYKHGCSFCRRRRNMGQVVLAFLLLVGLIAGTLVWMSGRLVR